MTIAELYEVCVGEGGMDPQYFAHTLTLYEAKLWLNGYRRRQQAAWEISRYQAYYSAAPHCKNFTFASMGEFPGEKEHAKTTAKQSKRKWLREIKAVRERARQRDEMIKRMKNGVG